MKPRIAIVALNIKKNNPSFSSFDKMTAKDKISVLATRMREICLELQKKEPHSTWMLACREYAITEADSRFISNATKIEFKKAMLELTKEFPQLTIISGTVATKTPFEDSERPTEKLKTLESDYKPHTWLIEKEKKDVSQVTVELEKIDKAKKTISGIDIIRNTCYVFHRDIVKKHDKTVPYMETKDPSKIKDEKEKSEERISIFLPGKSDSISPIIEIKEQPKIGVEICREHVFGVLRRASPNNKPFIHFILSDYVQMNLNHLHGDYVVQVDGILNSQLISTKNIDESKKEVCLYQNNLLDKSEIRLTSSQQPEYPIAKNILDSLSNVISKFPKDHPKRIALEEIHEVLGNSNPNSNNIYDCLNGLIRVHQHELVKPEKINVCASFFNFFKTALPDTVKLLGTLLGIAKQEQDKNEKRRLGPISL